MNTKLTRYELVALIDILATVDLRECTDAAMVTHLHDKFTLLLAQTPGGDECLPR